MYQYNSIHPLLGFEVFDYGVTMSQCYALDLKRVIRIVDKKWSFSCNAQIMVNPLLVVRISAFSDFEATHAKQGYRYRVVPYRQ